MEGTIGRVIGWMVVALFAGFLAVGCGGDGEAGASGDKVRVATTTTMITDLVRQVGGEKVEVMGLMA